MRTTLILASTLFTACSGVPCGTGTIEQNGECKPAQVATGSAGCGPDTILVGNQCVSSVVCDPDTTMPVTDPATGMTTCKGIAGGGCGACPAPSSSSVQSICGQIYNFEDNTPFTASGGSGMKCDPTMPAASGPCALGMAAYDALAFAANPSGATPLAVGDMCIDDMGRYYLKDIAQPAGPFIGIALDDIASANRGPGGETNLIGVATKKDPGNKTQAFEHWIVKASTTTAWATSGGPTISTGYYVPVYRSHCVDGIGSGPGCTGDTSVNQAGVMFANSDATHPTTAVYFQSAQTTRHDVDTAATMTGANGTALVTGATTAASLAYSGTGGLTDAVNCKWDTKAGGTLSGVVFIQVYRPVNVFGKVCTE
jgi:hypothetical protein